MNRGAAALVLVLGAVTPAQAWAGPAPLEEARRAAEHVVFEGVLEIRWRDGDVARSARLAVEAAGGSLVVRGANLAMAQPGFGRLVAHAGGGWEEMWLPSRAPTARPDGVSKYSTTTPTDGPAVAGRPTRLMEVRQGDALLERIYLDTETNLLLERDQYGARGEVVRQLAFVSVSVGASTVPPAEPRAPAHHASQAVGMDHLAPSATAPAVLADGYERMGVYRSGAVLQVLYSDGVYDLSLFQQQGRLRSADLPPSGQRVAVGAATGWRYAWPGGQMVMWSAGGKVFTAVSDAPADQVLAAVRSLPPVATRELSLLGKVRRACQALMEPLS